MLIHSLVGGTPEENTDIEDEDAAYYKGIFTTESEIDNEDREEEEF